MKQAKQNLHNFLIASNYLGFPLLLNSIGYFQIPVQVAGESLNFILDTGASKTVIHQGTAERLSLVLKDSMTTGGGVGTSEAKIYTVEIQEMMIHTYLITPIEIYAMDLGHVNEALLKREEKAVDGVIGFDLLDSREAVIDFKSRTLFLQKETLKKINPDDE